jgi:hypothetical protein
LLPGIQGHYEESDEHGIPGSWNQELPADITSSDVEQRDQHNSGLAPNSQSNDRLVAMKVFRGPVIAESKDGNQTGKLLDPDTLIRCRGYEKPRQERLWDEKKAESDYPVENGCAQEHLVSCIRANSSTSCCG